jgi:hypothetical protein
MKLRTWGTALAVIGCFAIVAVAYTAVAQQMKRSEYERRTADPRNSKYISGDKKSGYVYMTSVTRDMQDDDFGNPAFIWVDIGRAAWNKVEGTAGKSKLQSRGMPVNVSIAGPAKKFYNKGKAFFNKRRGLLDMSCKNCHVDNSGNMIRSNLLSEAQPNGFPTYRLKWQKVGSIHRRFAGCNKNIRAKPYKRGSPEYTNLELYLMHRANGLRVESPSVRN